MPGDVIGTLATPGVLRLPLAIERSVPLLADVVRCHVGIGIPTGYAPRVKGLDVSIHIPLLLIEGRVSPERGTIYTKACS